MRYDITTAWSAKTLLDGLFSARNYGIRHHGEKLDEMKSAVKRSRAISGIMKGSYFWRWTRSRFRSLGSLVKQRNDRWNRRNHIKLGPRIPQSDRGYVCQSCFEAVRSELNIPTMQMSAECMVGKFTIMQYSVFIR
jgi:hypothetical protein